jgi:hypothetical protein
MDDPVVVDTLRQLLATEQEERAVVVMAMAALCGQNQVLMAAMLAAQANEQGPPIVIRRR